MPRYFIHTENSETIADHEGFEFNSLADAKCQAVRLAGRLICDAADQFWDSSDFNMSVTDERGLILFSLRLVGTEAPAIRSSLGCRPA